MPSLPPLCFIIPAFYFSIVGILLGTILGGRIALYFFKKELRNER